MSLKRDFRTLWIVRINAFAREIGLTYAKLIHLLKTKNIPLNRKMLAEMAVRNPQELKQLISAEQ